MDGMTLSCAPSFRCESKRAWPRRQCRTRIAQGDGLGRSVRGIVGSEGSVASFALYRGMQALSMGRQHLAWSLLLAAERLGTTNQETSVVQRARGALGSGVPMVEAARRGGSLLLRSLAPSGAGRRLPDCAGPGARTAPHRETARGAGDRFAAWLVGGEVPRVDCSSEEGFQEALGHVAQRVPVVMLNLNLMPATQKWDVEYLRRHCNEWPGMNVLRSDSEENRYLYYVPEQADRDMSAFQNAPRRASADLRLSFENFLQRSKQDPKGCYYLQAPMVLRNATEKGIQETWNRGMDAELRADCERRVNWQRFEALQAAGGFGYWSRSQLFVGPSESLSPVHYDQYDNIYMQVAGEKRFLLFDPRCAEGLYPFPVSHPYDEYAMVDLEHPDLHSYPKLRSLEKRGLVASVNKGEAIFIPTHWWHHVQGITEPDDGPWSISVNFWFAIHKVLLEGPHPYPPHLELELARHVELLLSDVAGSAAVGSAARELREDAEPPGRTASELMEENLVTLPLRNFILDRLAQLLGPGEVKDYLAEHFPPERFQRSLVAKALDSAVEK